jgi:hypothetical protein
VRPETYYRTSLALPIVLPLLVAGPGLLTSGMDGMSSGFGGFLGMSLVFGGVPYLVTAGILLFLMRRMDARGMARLTWLAPLLMLPVAWACWYAFSAVTNDRMTGEAGMMLLLSGFVLAFGYAYVVAVHVGRLVLSALGLVRSPVPACPLEMPLPPQVSSQSATAAQVASEKPL